MKLHFISFLIGSATPLTHVLFKAADLRPPENQGLVSILAFSAANPVLAGV